MRRKDGRRLVKVPHVARAAEILYELMKEQEPWQSISHKEMPTWEEHVSFVERFPFRMWYLIEADGEFVGHVLFTRHQEIGVRIFKAHQRKGHGKWAVEEILRMWRKLVSTSRKPAVQRQAFIANINPANEQSQALFKSLGFKHIQNTYALDIE